MERLTERFGNSVILNGCRRQYVASELTGQYTRNAVVRLAAYEDSGLTPEEVAELAKIVRCKDCRRSTSSMIHKRNRYCRKFKRDVGENAFCSYGENGGE